jgi:hypothetical protein
VVRGSSQQCQRTIESDCCHQERPPGNAEESAVIFAEASDVRPPISLILQPAVQLPQFKNIAQKYESVCPIRWGGCCAISVAPLTGQGITFRADLPLRPGAAGWDWNDGTFLGSLKRRSGLSFSFQTPKG